MTEITSLTYVTDAVLADLTGVSSRRIRQLAEAGTLERVERGRYELGPSIRALLDDAADKGSELQKERTRKVRADADLAELQLAKEKGEVAPIAEFEAVQRARAQLIQTNVLNVAQRAVLQLLGESDERTFKTKLRAELVLALQTAANSTIQLTKEEAKND